MPLEMVCKKLCFAGHSSALCRPYYTDCLFLTRMQALDQLPLLSTQLQVAVQVGEFLQDRELPRLTDACASSLLLARSWYSGFTVSYTHLTLPTKA